jgi:outer membrane protein TolC
MRFMTSWEWPYYPKASFRMEGGVDQAYSVAANGPTYYTRGRTAPGFFLEYLLVDFGRRRADVERTLFALDAASLRYDRQLQRTIFGVQRSYFAHSAALEGEESAERLAEQETVRAELEIQRLDTILDVWSSYYAVFTSRRRVQFAQAALKSSQENFDAAQAFFEDGLATAPELVSAQSELAAARSERARAIADYLTAIASLTLAMGRPVTTASKEGSSSKYPPAAPSVPPSTKPQKTPAHFSDGSSRAF